MKLDRNTNPDGRGKYALVKLRELTDEHPPEVRQALSTLRGAGLLYFGNESPGEQFFVLKYSDLLTAPTLRAYAHAAAALAEENSDAELAEFAREILAEADTAEGSAYKIPD